VAKKQKTQTTEETYTQVVPVVFCSNEVMVQALLQRSGTVKAQTYNLFGSLKGWGVSPMSSPDKKLRGLFGMAGFDDAKKLHEWQSLDTVKAIGAQQEAAKSLIGRKIWRKCPMSEVEKQRRQWLSAHRKGEKATKAEVEQSYFVYPRCTVQIERERLYDLLNHDPTGDAWLHRVFRDEYQRGHTFQRNQVVYQSQGYRCKRLTRNTVMLTLNGLTRKDKVQLNLKCRHVLTGQIRVIQNEQGEFEVHCTRRRQTVKVVAAPSQSIGVDKGYTEAFFTSDGEEIGKGLGKLMTAKTERIARTNRNRYRIRCHALTLTPEKQAAMLESNLGYKVKSRKLAREKNTIKSFIRADLRRMVTVPTVIYAEDLTQPIRGKQQAKRINRKLNQWMKGELQDSLEVIAKETGSIVKTVNPAYTSQMDHLTGTLLGNRAGDRFTRITGNVIQSDKNAAKNILMRGSDSEITRYMKASEVRTILLIRTVRYLASIGKTVTEAVNLGWLHSKFTAEAYKLEAELSPHGVSA
jgi:IS605 OrfB family transposase